MLSNPSLLVLLSIMGIGITLRRYLGEKSMEAYLLLSIRKQRIFGPLFPLNQLKPFCTLTLRFLQLLDSPSYREMNKAKLKAVASTFSKPLSGAQHTHLF